MYTIGLAGGTGSGKTTIVNWLIKEMETSDVVVLSQDNYYRNYPELSFEERCNLNFDHPKTLDFELLTEHLEKLRNGFSIEQPLYSFEEHKRLEKTLSVQPASVVIVEGILILHSEELRNSFNLKVFIHADSDERLIRRILRDTKHRGRSIDEVLDRYRNTLKPMHELFIEPSKEYADLIIPNSVFKSSAVELLAEIVKNKAKHELWKK